VIAHKPVTRIGPVGVELVFRREEVIVNYHVNGLVASSHVTQHKAITIPEALILLATEIRMGNITTPINHGA
jgi:hypothetical protein